MKITFICFFLFLFLSCKKEVVHDLQGPKYLLTSDIYLKCEAFNPAESDFISFNLNNTTHCVTIERPTSIASSCDATILENYGPGNSWYQIGLCAYNHFNGHNTNLLLYLSKSDFEENIKNLVVGNYEFYQEGMTILPSDNLFKVKLAAASESLIQNSNPAFVYTIINSFESESASQNDESYMRITGIETLQQGNTELKRFHFEFACTLQDQRGRNIQIKNGSAAITVKVN